MHGYALPPSCKNCPLCCKCWKQVNCKVFFSFIHFQNASQKEGRRKTNTFNGKIWNVTEVRNSRASKCGVSWLNTCMQQVSIFFAWSWVCCLSTWIFRKSTFFNVLTKSAAAAENFPFCTIGQCIVSSATSSSKWSWDNCLYFISMFSVSYPSGALRSSQISREDGRSCGNFETPLGYMGVLSLLIKISMSWNCVAVSELIYFTENQWIRLQSMRFISFIFLNAVELINAG